MQGLHIIADFYNCPPSQYLTSAVALRQLCVEACQASGLTALGAHFHQFDGFNAAHAGGATGTVVLAESHLAIHTWPERLAATLDIYVCNVSVDNSARAEHLYAELATQLRPADIVVERLWRGRDLPVAALARAAA